MFFEALRPTEAINPISTTLNNSFGILISLRLFLFIKKLIKSPINKDIELPSLNFLKLIFPRNEPIIMQKTIKNIGEKNKFI